MSVDLPPCPICGSAARLVEDNDHHGEWFNLGCGSGVPDIGEPCPAHYAFYTCDPSEKADAIAAWNRRADGVEPVAWTGSGSLAAIAIGLEGYIWRDKAASCPIALYASPPRASAPVTPGPDAEEVATVAEREGSREAIPPIPHAMGEGAVAWTGEVYRHPWVPMLREAVADGFTNGNEQYDDADEAQQRRYDMAVYAVLVKIWHHATVATQPKAVTIDDAMVERAARAHDAEESAQKGEPSPWTHYNCDDGDVTEADCPDCKAFRDERLFTMRVALTAALSQDGEG